MTRNRAREARDSPDTGRVDTCVLLIRTQTGRLGAKVFQASHDYLGTIGKLGRYQPQIPAAVIL